MTSLHNFSLFHLQGCISIEQPNAHKRQIIWRDPGAKCLATGNEKNHETRDSNLTGPRRPPNLETCLEILQNGRTKRRKYKVVQGMSSRCHQKALCFAARPS